MTAKTFPPLDPEHLEAVTTYAAKHGRRWKHSLGVAWGKGTDTHEHLGHCLRNIRNHPSYGHDWLDAYRLPKLENDQ